MLLVFSGENCSTMLVFLERSLFHVTGLFLEKLVSYIPAVLGFIEKLVLFDLYVSKETSILQVCF